MLDLLFGGGSDGGISSELRRALEAYEGIAIPDDVWKDIAPEAAQYESADYQLINEDPETRAAQMRALARMSGLAESGLSDVDAQGFENARQMGAQMARSGREAAIQDAQARGVGGSGMEFALREIANQGGAQRAQEAALNQAAESAKQRALYNQAFLQGSSNLRAQDLSANAANADIINRFNAANTQGRNQTNQMNVASRNDAARYNQEGRLGLNQQRFSNQMAKAGGVAGVSGQLANARAAQNASRQSGLNQLINVGTQLGLGAVQAFGGKGKRLDDEEGGGYGS